MEKKKNLNTDDLLNMPLDDLVKMNQNKNKQRNNFNKNRNTNRFYNNNQRYQSNYRYNNRDNRRYYNNYNDRRHEPFNKFDHVDRNKQRDTRTRLFITNLHRGVTNQELQKLFPVQQNYSINELLSLEEYMNAHGIKFRYSNNCVRDWEYNKSVYENAVLPNRELIKGMLALQNVPHFKGIYKRKDFVDFTLIDGSKFEANAHKYSWVWKKATEKSRYHLYDKIYMVRS